MGEMLLPSKPNLSFLRDLKFYLFTISAIWIWNKNFQNNFGRQNGNSENNSELIIFVVAPNKQQKYLISHAQLINIEQ